MPEPSASQDGEPSWAGFTVSLTGGPGSNGSSPVSGFAKGSLWLQADAEMTRQSRPSAVHLAGVTDERCVIRSLKKGRDRVGDEPAESDRTGSVRFRDSAIPQANTDGRGRPLGLGTKLPHRKRLPQIGETARSSPMARTGRRRGAARTHLSDRIVAWTYPVHRSIAVASESSTAPSPWSRWSPRRSASAVSSRRRRGWIARPSGSTRCRRARW